MSSVITTLGSSDTWSLSIILLLFSGHIVLFIDLSRLQKQPLNRLNFLLAVLISALVPAFLIPQASVFASDSELLLGVELAGTAILSTLLALTLQSVLKIDLDF